MVCGDISHLSVAISSTCSCMLQYATTPPRRCLQAYILISMATVHYDMLSRNLCLQIQPLMIDDASAMHQLSINDTLCSLGEPGWPSMFHCYLCQHTRSAVHSDAPHTAAASLERRCIFSLSSPPPLMQLRCRPAPASRDTTWMALQLQMTFPCHGRARICCTVPISAP